MKGLFGALFAPETKMTSSELDDLLRTGTESGSGTTVNWQTALQVTTVLGCARVIAEGVAQVPWRVYYGGPERAVAEDHWLSDLLYRRPNPWQSSFEFRETILFHLVLTNNAFIRKLRVGRDRRLASLEPMEPQRVTVCREADGRLRYRYQAEHGPSIDLDPADVWHIRGPSWNSWAGMEPVKLAREALGLSIALEAGHARLHKSGVAPSGAYSVKDPLGADEFDKLSKWISRFAPGGDKAGTPMILDREAKWLNQQMTGVDSQHLETRKHQIEEICRAFRVMPIMIGQSDKASTYASAEQMFLAHVVHTLMPWYERIEQSADINLLTPDDRAQGIYTKFNPNALMRGAAKDRAEYYAKALGAGGTPAWMTQDEVRALDELGPMGGPAAELQQGAMNAAAAAAPGDTPNG